MLTQDKKIHYKNSAFMSKLIHTDTNMSWSQTDDRVTRGIPTVKRGSKTVFERLPLKIPFRPSQPSTTKRLDFQSLRKSVDTLRLS